MPNTGAFPLGAAFASGDQVLSSEGKTLGNPRARAVLSIHENLGKQNGPHGHY